MHVHEAHTVCIKRSSTFSKLWLLGFVAILLYSCTTPVPKTPVASPDYPLDAIALSLRIKADSSYYAGKPDSALVFARASAEKAEKTADWHTWGEAQTYILASQYELKAYAESAETFPALEQKARVLIPEGNLRDSAFWGDYYNTAGAICNELGNYEQALKYGLQEIAFYEKFGNKVSLALANNNVAKYYLNRGDYDRALDYSLAALQGFATVPETDPSDLVWTYWILSEVWYRKTNYLNSIGYAEKGLAMLQPECTDCKERQADLQYTIAINYIALKKYESAVSYLNRACEIQQSLIKPKNLNVTLNSLGYVYSMTGQYKKSLFYLQAALAAFGPGNPNYGKTCRLMGQLYQFQGDLWTALEWKQKALQSLTNTAGADLLTNPELKDVNQYYDLMYALVEKGDILRLLAKKETKPALLEASLAAIDLATVVLDSMRTVYQEGSKQFWNQEARPVLEKAIDNALQLEAVNGNGYYMAKAFAYSEKGKAYLLAESLQESMAGQKAGIPDALLAEEKQIKIDIAFYQKKIFETTANSAPDNEKTLLWQSEIWRRRRDYEVLMAKLETEYPAYYQIKYKQNIPTIADIQKAIPSNTGLLEYFRGDSATYVFYIDGQQARAARCGPDSAMTRLLDGLRDPDRVAEQGHSVAAVQAFSKDAASLYRVLVAPVLSNIPEKLILIPDGQLAYIPFEVLLTDDIGAITPTFATLPYLLRKTTIRYEYSALLAFKEPIESHPVHFFDGYAPEYARNNTLQASRGGRSDCRQWYAADFAALPNNRLEVEQVAKLTGGRAICGNEATESYFRQHAHEPRILHLAMHGFFNDCNPAFSGLVFSAEPGSGQKETVPEERDTILHAYEVYNMHFNAELAVLSACNTGRGQLAKGEGVMSMARAFKYAGCPNVLMSLWQADDASTANIMEKFYTYLKAGKGKAAAIQQAKLDCLDAPRNHPFYWGAFVLIGDDQPMTQTSHWWWMAIGLLMLGGAMFWFKKRT